MGLHRLHHHAAGEGRDRLQAIPSFARGMVVQAVEAYARSGGHPVVTPEMMAEVRQRWGARFAPRA